MTTKRFNFTAKSISRLSHSNAESSTRTYYHDTQVRGLGIYVTQKGVKTFFVYKKIDGRPARIILGRTDEITLEQARAKAQTVHSQVAEGINPQEKKRTLREEATLGELWEMYLEHHAKLHRTSWKRNDDALYRLYLATWAERKLSSITAHTIRQRHTEIGKMNGTVRANHVHALLRLMFNKAIEWGWNKPNPAYAVKRFKEVSRERFLNMQEMKSFLSALDKEPCETVRDYIYMSLFTGARRSNVQAMRWEQIDFESACWVIPTTKNGKPHIIPLVQQAVDILERRRKKTNSDWVFSSAKSKSGHLENPVYVWSRILKGAGILNLRIHDLRRTLGSWQAALGANSFIIGKSLGHASPQATAIYARLDLNPVRQSLTNAVQAMFAKKEAEVSGVSGSP